MDLKLFKIDQLELLLPPSLVVVPDALQKSIAEQGVIVPPVICGKTVCDGHRRLIACKKNGIESLFCFEVSGSAGLLFAELNSNRELNAFEAAAVCFRLDENEQAAFLQQTGISESPQMRNVLSYIATEILPCPDLLNFSMPVNIWRELAHLGNEINRYAKALLTLPGTVSEKRSIASMLRQAHRRHELPDSLPGSTAPEILANMQKIAQPRRTGALEKYEHAVKGAQLPHGVTLKIDPTFAQPGIQLTVHLTRNATEKLVDAHRAVNAIFAEVEEL
ncbi:MAG: hypothetical protein EOM80_10685 [Erysipelotrichia bacterium]|nr:hypothetical protein [Erysipelotrichia bacterium]